MARSRHAIIAALCLLSGTAFAEKWEGRVVRVADGDTITVLDSSRQMHKTRLTGIDAPEKAQPFGQRSKANLSAIAFNRVVEIDGNRRDRYGRILAKVMVADPNCNATSCPKLHDAGLMQIKSGLAWWYRQ